MRRAREPEAKMLGDGSHRWHQHHRVVYGNLYRLRQGGDRVTAEDVVHTKHVCDEERVDFAPLKGFREFRPVFYFVVVQGLVSWMRPHAGRDMPNAVHVKSIYQNLFRRDVSHASACECRSPPRSSLPVSTNFSQSTAIWSRGDQRSQGQLAIRVPPALQLIWSPQFAQSNVTMTARLFGGMRFLATKSYRVTYRARDQMMPIGM